MRSSTMDDVELTWDLTTMSKVVLMLAFPTQVATNLFHVA